jgi:hypothetical protein
MNDTKPTCGSSEIRYKDYKPCAGCDKFITKYCCTDYCENCILLLKERSRKEWQASFEIAEEGKYVRKRTRPIVIQD